MKLEFQPIILAAGHGSRIVDLTTKTPKALLPVGNMPMVWYIIHALEEAGFEEAIIILLDKQRDMIVKKLGDLDIKLKLDAISIPSDSDWGTADSLRHIKDKIKKQHLLVISCDLIIMGNQLHQFLDVHRIYNPICTAFFVEQPDFLQNIPIPGPKTKRKMEKDFVGVSGDGSSQLLFLTSEADVNDEISINAHVLKRHTNMKLYRKLMDSHLYIFNNQVIEILLQEKSISTIKGELLPHLIDKQFSHNKKEALTDHEVADDDLIDLNSLVQELNSASLISRSTEQSEKKCYIYISNGDDGLAVRVNTLPHYSEINRQISRYWKSLNLPTERQKLVHPTVQQSPKSQVGADCMVGSGSVIGEKTSIKHSVVGSHCNIGNHCKIINSIILDYANIEDGCEINGSVIADNAHLGAEAKVKECIVCSNQQVNTKSKITNEAVIDEQRMMEI